MPSSDVRRFYQHRRGADTRGRRAESSSRAPLPGSPNSSGDSGGGLGLGLGQQQLLPSRKQQQLLPSRKQQRGADFRGYGVSPDEYLTKRKVETKTTKNREKRVQRRVVLEDGRVIERDEPEITVDRVEDTETREEEQLEHADRPRRAGIGWRQEQQQRKPRRRHKDGADDDAVVGDSFQRTVNTHDVKENLVKTSVSKNLGQVSRRAVERALRGDKKSKLKFRKEGEECVSGGRELGQKPKVVYETSSHKKIIDTEDIHNISRRLDNGKVLTETIRTQQHEVIDDKDEPDSDSKAASDVSEHVVKDQQRYKHRKKDEFTEYYRVPAESKSLRRCGGAGVELLGRGAHLTTEDKEVQRGKYDWDEVSERFRRQRELVQQRLHAGEASDRTDALTKRPLNFVQEEKTRKKETDKWLEQHFGSDWSLSSQSQGGGRMSNQLSTHQQQHRQHVIDHFGRKGTNDGKHGVRRSMSFSSIPVAYHGPGGEVTTTTERIVKTTTTTYKPGADKTVEVDVARERHVPQRQYHSTINLATTPKVVHDFVIQAEPAPEPAHTSTPIRKANAGAGSASNLSRRSNNNNINNHSLFEDRSRGHLYEDRTRSHSGSALLNRTRNMTAAAARSESEVRGQHRSVHVTEERYSDPPKEKKLYPTLERQTDKNSSRVVYRSDSKRATERARQPLYITELRREKLYPATSENNLLAASSSFANNRGGLMRNYLGYRSMERSDAVSAASAGSGSQQSSSDSQGRQQQQQPQRRRSQSFLVKSTRPQFQAESREFRQDTVGHSSRREQQRQFEQDSYTYERKLVEREEERRSGRDSGWGGGGAGQFAFRLERREQRGPELVERKVVTRPIRPSPGPPQHRPHPDLHSREIVHQQEQLEPQLFKTIIFLSGN